MASATHKIVLAASVAEHLRWLSAAERGRVLDSIDRQLTQEPRVETRNRRPMRPNPLATWELRVGFLRVFYEVVGGDPSEVRVLAVGKKERSILRIGGREMVL